MNIGHHSPRAASFAIDVLVSLLLAFPLVSPAADEWADCNMSVSDLDLLKFDDPGSPWHFDIASMSVAYMFGTYCYWGSPPYPYKRWDARFDDSSAVKLDDWIEAHWQYRVFSFHTHGEQDVGVVGEVYRNEVAADAARNGYLYQRDIRGVEWLPEELYKSETTQAGRTVYGVEMTKDAIRRHLVQQYDHWTPDVVFAGACWSKTFVDAFDYNSALVFPGIVDYTVYSRQAFWTCLACYFEEAPVQPPVRPSAWAACESTRTGPLYGPEADCTLCGDDDFIGPRSVDCYNTATSYTCAAAFGGGVWFETSHATYSVGFIVEGTAEVRDAATT